MVAIDGLPAESWPGILGTLDLMPLTYRWSTRFIFLDAEEARQKLERMRKKWQQKVRPFFDQLFQTQSRSIDQDAMTMVAETEDAIAQASSQLVAYGYYTPVVILFDDDREALQEKAEAIRRLVQAEGFGARIETLNATDAYLGSLPGNWYCNIREPLINTNNLADLVPLNSVWSGSPVAPCPFYPSNSPPLMQVASGSTPFRLNLHVDDVGHTLIFGPTGSGKSTLLALIAAQFRRYEHAQIFAFDKGHSLMPLTLAAGGNHYDIGGDRDTNERRLSFCPLWDLNTDSDRAWASEWIETLVTMQGITITPDHRNAISRQISLMAAAQGRSLSDFVSGVQMREIKDALHHYTVDGPMGQLLDAEEDGLTLRAFQCFEIEQLMNLGERSLVPVLTYLFRRIEKRLDGSPSLIVLDEAWLMLGHPVFRAKIREWLKVLRKANCAVVLATQSISDAERSGIIDVLKESCPTKICLPNGAAREAGTREFYERIGFNERPDRDRRECHPEAGILRRDARGEEAVRHVAWPCRAQFRRRLRKGRSQTHPRAEFRAWPLLADPFGLNREESTMPDRTSPSHKWLAGLTIGATLLTSAATTQAGSATGAATEWTQLANNAQLIDLMQSSGLQVDNQLTQISQLAEQIQNQLKIYENMLQNTAQLPNHIWGQVEDDLDQLRSIVDQGQSIAFSMGNADDVLKQRFKSYADLHLTANAESFSTTYQSWSDTIATRSAAR